MELQVQETEKGRFISARDLHEFLEVGRDFTTWIKVRISTYQFKENEDYQVISIAPQNGGANKRGGHNKIDYHLSIDMAKELSMIENNEKGRLARKYFIECEKIHTDMLRARVNLLSGNTIDITQTEEWKNILKATDDFREKKFAFAEQMGHLMRSALDIDKEVEAIKKAVYDINNQNKAPRTEV